jgi:uncharacterized protein YbaR (Trm112 family)
MLPSSLHGCIYGVYRKGMSPLGNAPTTGRHILDKKLLDILACPLCKGPLVYDKEHQELICKADRLAYPIRDDIPVMLEEEARQLPAEEDV